MLKYNPSIPPHIQRRLPADPFEAWLVKQALAGHDRQWIERNRVALEQRWQRDPSELPLLPEPDRTYDRYSEV
jgi:hypothetical protein